MVRDKKPRAKLSSGGFEQFFPPGPLSCAGAGRNAEVSSRLDASALRQLENPEQYLGVTETFRQSLVSSSQKTKTPNKKEQ